MKNTDIGFNKEQILAICLNFRDDRANKLDALKQEMSGRFSIDRIATGDGGTQLGSTGEWIKSINSVKNADGVDIQFISN